MMNDASDGVMNGMMGGSGISIGGMGGGMMNGDSTSGMQGTAGTSGLAGAMQDFMGSDSNRSGLTAADIQGLIDQLNASDGSLQ